MRTLRETVLVPALAALLPWPNGFRALSRKAADEFLYRESTDAALAGARTVIDVGDGTEWKRRHRLVRLVDHCDMYLMRSRSRRWLARHVDVDGAWPAAAPFIAMTFHWGAGLWSLAHLRAHGFRARFLSARIDKSAFHGDAVAHAYARLRNRTVEAAGGAPVIYIGGASDAIRGALNEGQVVVALYDVPAADDRATLATTVCDMPIRLPAGLARLAAATGVPVVPFSMGIDYRTGRRKLRIEPSFRPATAQDFADRLGASLSRLIREDSPAWHFSAFAPRFFANHGETGTVAALSEPAMPAAPAGIR